MKTFTLETDAFTAKYDYLWRLSEDRWAWEYARRSNKVRRYAESRTPDDISEMQAPYADPAKNGFEADVVWTRLAYPDQVEVNCSSLRPGQTCDIWERTVPICNITHITDSIGREFLLIRGKGCVVQVRCTGLSLLGMEPVRMNLTISDLDAFERKVKAQKAALALIGDGPDLTEPRWTKRTEMLRNGLIALDCLEAGLNRREIAEVIFGKDRVAEDWNGPSLKHSMRYLILKAEALRDGGYLVELLGSQFGITKTAA